MSVWERRKEICMARGQLVRFLRATHALMSVRPMAQHIAMVVECE